MSDDPEDLMIDRIRGISQNARATWFGLLALIAFVGVTLMGHRDADFFAKGAETQLPLVDVSVPTEVFFWVAPLLLAATYAYFHLYLIALWDALAEAKAEMQDRPLSDAIFPWLLSQSAVWTRRRARQDGSMPPRAMAGITALVSITLTWVFAPVLLGFLWERAQALHDPWLALWTSACLGAATLIGARALWVMLTRMRLPAKERDRAHRLPAWQAGAAVLALSVLGDIAWDRAGGPRPVGSDTWPLRQADLTNAELTPRPADWKPFEMWLADHRGAKDWDPDLDPMIPTRAEMARWKLVIDRLDAPNLQSRDLRQATASGAYLPGTDLGGAQMQGADLRGAEMQQAYCNGADFLAALLHSADVTCRNLDPETIQYAVGDDRTTLPDGLRVKSCLDRREIPADVLARIEAVIPDRVVWHEGEDKPYRDALFCPEGQTYHMVGRDPAPE